MLPDVEGYLKASHLNFLNAMLSANHNAFDVSIVKAVNDIYTDVYGNLSGEHSAASGSIIRALCAGDTFGVTDDHESGLFKEGWMFTTSSTPNVGDMVDITRADGRKRRYHVDDKQTLGTSQAVFYKYHLSSRGD